MFDYIIVGAGSAGCVMANRLSRDGAKRVCLIEAGPKDSSPFIDMPLGVAVLARLRGWKWPYQTEPEPQTMNRSHYWPRGKTLGGSSSVNGMIYIRGNPEDYREWARQAGPEWDWPRVKEVFKRVEHNTFFDNDDHGTTGPLYVSNQVQPNPLSLAFVEAAGQCQYPINPDFNGPRQDGFGLYQVTQRNGRRWSSARAFLDPVKDRANLTIRTDVLVHRVRFKDGRAVGVECADGLIPLAPGGEVILCGGAINSPHLLMLSGIGPADHLRDHGIEVVADRPQVGRNLADHYDVSIVSSTKGREPIGVAPSFIPRALRAVWDYFRHSKGELTSNVGEAGGFMASDPSQPRPNLQFHLFSVVIRDHGRKTPWGYGTTLHVCDLLPKSRGRVCLNSADPTQHARIEAGYLSHPDDVQTLLAGLKLGRKILSAPAMARYIKAELEPGPDVQSDADLIADIRARAETVYHPVGTCRMGLDADSVVDPQGRVRGVTGLRVVDASIMPTIPAGNTNAPTIMLADHIAEMMTSET